MQRLEVFLIKLLYLHCKIEFMENYIVSARKYRPMTFDAVVGQTSLTTTLKNAIHNGKLAHAYLFCGPRGVGKTTCARIFAKTINCLSPREDGEACNECESCKAFNEQRSLNIHELDAASNNSVEDIRQIIDQVRIPPQLGKYKVFIIDEVHMLSTQAFNAFLKTLEEPPHHAIFILATTEKHKLLATILSRCQIYDFNRMGIDDIVSHLKNVAEKEGITYEPEALNVIAQKADGGMRDALSIFDQISSFCQGNITYNQTINNLNVLDSDYYFRFTDYILACGNGDPKSPKADRAVIQENITNCLLTLNEILSKGFDGQHFINGLASHMRNLLVSRDAQTVKLIEASDDIREKYKQQAARCTPRLLYNAMRLCNDCDLQYKTSENKRLLVELTLIEVAQTAEGEDVPGSGRSPKKILHPIFTARTAKPAANANKPANIKQDHPAQTFNLSAPTPEGQKITARRFSIRRNQASPETPESASPEQISNNAVSATNNRQLKSASNSSLEVLNEANLIIVWKEFISQLSQNEAAIAQRMKVIEPTLMNDGNSFEVVANNNLVAEELQKIAPRVEQFIRRRISNSKVKMNIRLRNVSDKKRIFTPQEAFLEMCKENEALGKLKEILQLEVM